MIVTNQLLFFFLIIYLYNVTITTMWEWIYAFHLVKLVIFLDVTDLLVSVTLGLMIKKKYSD